MVNMCNGKLDFFVVMIMLLEVGERMIVVGEVYIVIVVGWEMFIVVIIGNKVVINNMLRLVVEFMVRDIK